MAPKGEQRRIARILDAGRPAPFASVQNGDDGAALRLREDVVLSVDAQVDGVHFRRSFADFRTLGHRAALSALSDLAAMGAAPRALLSSLMVPADVDDEDVHGISAGIEDAAKGCGAFVVGGNLASAQELVIDTTVIGESARPVRRDGAKVGECLCLTRHPGHAALGLAMLMARDEGTGLSESHGSFVRAWLEPALRFDLASAMSAAIDLSDGLSKDGAALARDVRIELRAEALDALAHEQPFASACAEFGLDPAQLVLHGGESYALACTMREDRAAELGLIVIGDVCSGSAGLYAQDARLRDGAFDHF